MDARLKFHNIPEELRLKPNWCNWLLEDAGTYKPSKVPYNSKTGKRMSVSNRNTWSDFNTAYNALGNYMGMGYVFDRESNIVGADLDNPRELLEDGTPKYSDPEKIIKTHTLIMTNLTGYWERSFSGEGAHGIFKGTLPSGVRRDAVELYPFDRFFVMTGDVITSTGILTDQNTLLNQLYSEMKSKDKQLSNDIAQLTKPQLQSDRDIFDIASRASNGLKFIELWNGNWTDLYPSQSEADQSFINIISFYTQNVEQIVRLFHMSALGQRPKAKRNDYLMKPNYGLIPKAFDKMLPTFNMDTLRNNLEAQLANCGQSEPEIAQIPAQVGMPLNQPVSDPYLSIPPVENALCRANLEAVFLGNSPKLEQSNLVAPIPVVLPVQVPVSTPEPMQKSAYSIPPGIIGEIARFIHDAAPRPVPEIAIAGAIGLMAGICGRAYNVSGTGLNQYTFLIAMTGAGKDGLSGIDKLMAATYRTVPAAIEFIGPAEIASPQALTKYLSKTSKSFVSLVGEFSIKLKQICSQNAHSNDSGLKRAFLDLYAKSGHNKTLGKMIYSDKDKNTDVVTGPAFSLLGEGTPEKFYEMLNKEMIEEGLLPRFLIMEYKGKRPKFNVGHNEVVPSAALSDYFASICAYCLQLNNGNNVLDVKCDAESQVMFDKYNDQCDKYINTGNEVSRQLWNRAHLKALKLAALLAVGVNYVNPIINAECARWALDIVTSDIKNLLGRFETGDVGASNVQNDQVTEIKKCLKAYLTKDWSELQSYPGATLATWNMKATPHSYISSVCRTKTAFKTDRLGPIQAIKTILASMLDSGEIVELSPLDKKQKGLASTAKVYMVTNLNSL